MFVLHGIRFQNGCRAINCAPRLTYPHGLAMFHGMTAREARRRIHPSLRHNHHFANGYTHFKVLRAEPGTPTFASDKSMFHSGCAGSHGKGVSSTPRGVESALRFNCYVSCSKREASCSVKAMMSLLFLCHIAGRITAISGRKKAKKMGYRRTPILLTLNLIL